MLIYILSISLSLIFAYALKCQANQTLGQNIEVLYDGIDEISTNIPLGETGIIDNKIELWHFSGGYWKYKNLVIYDTDLGKDLTNEKDLEQKLNEEIEFKIAFDNSLYNKLIKYKKLKVVCSSSLKTQKTSEYIPITELFYDKPTIELKNNKIYFKAKPKLHFHTEYTYQEIINDKFNVAIPIVDPDYGCNLYSIFRRTKNDNIGATASYFDKDNPYATAPPETNLIAPAQIKNADGHLYSGFSFKTGDTTRRSDSSSVGYYTLRNGGAVGILFNYPIKFTFYGDDYPSDLAVNFETLPSSAVKGQHVQICVNVNSNFEMDIENVPFKWEITKSNGTALDGLTFQGASELAEGSINIPTSTKEAVFYANFIMPDSDVKIKFSINSEGNAPVEAYLDNNFIDSGESIKLVEPVSYVGKFDLDYNVLSRNIEFPLINGKDIIARLSLPQGKWYDSARGQLNVVNEAKGIYNNFSAKHTKVDEYSSTIVLNPIINMTLQRSNFNDNPQGKVYLNLANPFEPISKEGVVTFDGSVRRRYIYNYYTYSKREDGSIDREEHSQITSTSAAFNSGTDVRDIRVFTYNGREKMPKVASRNFRDEVKNNGWRREMFWTSDMYKFDVIRWMCHLDTNNNSYNWTKIDGQYKRSFTQQNTADITWSVKNPMVNLYSYDRENARNMKYGKEYYPNAVFASDRVLQKHDWPIKSGYYFNPLGEYTCTVKTLQYKNTPDSTIEHTDLVNKIKNSFHYTSNMQYTADGKTYQSLDLHNGNDKIFGMDMLDIKTTYNKNKTKLESYDDSDNADKTDKFFKEILEGYSESNTLDSKENFKYREYIKQGDIYKVEETTVITFKVAPPSKNQKLYTYINMKDGKYLINARVNNIELGDYAFKGLNVNGFNSIDNIVVNVNGTYYDDQNAIIGY